MEPHGIAIGQLPGAAWEVAGRSRLPDVGSPDRLGALLASLRPFDPDASPNR